MTTRSKTEPSSHPALQSEGKQEPSPRELRVARWMMATAILLYPLWTFAYQRLFPAAQDPLLGRLAVAGLVGIALAATWHPRVVKHLHAVMLTLFVLMVSQFLYLVSLNHFSAPYVTGSFIVLTAINVSITHRRVLVLFSLYVILAALGLTMTVPSANSWFFFFGLATVQVVSFISLVWRIHLERSLFASREALDRTEAGLREAQAIAHLGSWVWDLRTRHLSWSDENYRIHGFEPRPGAMNYAAFLELLHPDDRDALAAAVEKALHEHQPFATIYRHRLPDGSMRVAQARAEVEVDREGRAARLFGTSQDITERWFAEQEIERLRRQQRREFELMVNSVKDYAIFMLDPTGRVVTWNEGARHIMGYDEHEVLGKPFSAFFTPEDLAAERPAAILEQTRRQGHVEEERHQVRKTGECFWASLSYSTVFDEQGQLIGYARILRDLTEWKQVEEVKREVAALKHTDRMKNEFLSVISHELRTPLNFITGFSSILQDEVVGPLNDLQKAYLGKILAGSDRMLGLVNDLLDMSRIQAGKLHLDIATVEYAPLVSDVLSSLQPLAAEKQLALRADVPAQTLLRADERRLVQVLTNLVTNAIKFTPAGGSIAVTALLEGQQVVTEVSDTGTGIAPQDQSKLFKPFTQLDMSSTRQVGGTGLGLTISKGLVEAHGGRIGVRSTPGTGSTFWFSLPTGSLGHGAADTPSSPLIPV